MRHDAYRARKDREAERKRAARGNARTYAADLSAIDPSARTRTLAQRRASREAREAQELADHVRVSKKRSRAATRSVRRTDAFDEASQQAIVDTVRAGMVAETGDAATGRGALARGARSLLGFKAGETVGERVRRELAKVLRAHPHPTGSDDGRPRRPWREPSTESGRERGAPPHVRAKICPRGSWRSWRRSRHDVAKGEF